MSAQPQSSIPARVDFATNLNPWGPPESVVRSLQSGGKAMLVSYPEYPAKKSILAVAEWLQVPPEAVCLGNGATELVVGSMCALSRTEGVIVAPTFWQFAAGARKAGGVVHKVLTSSASGFQFEEEALEDLLRALPSSRTCVYLCNPNNPTGILLPARTIRELVQRYPEVLFIVDETYLLFRSDEQTLSLRTAVGGHPNLVVVFSLSKFFAVPGLRIGVGVATPHVARKLSAALTPFGVNSLAQALLPVLIGDTSFQQSSRRYFELEKQRICGRLHEFEASPFVEPSANFFLLCAPQVGRRRSCAGFLRERGLRVRCGTELDDLNGDYVRFCMRKPDENDLLLSALQEYVFDERGMGVAHG
jgi:histidinol-phosphate/aromatic aminotransferase/cobyric acid decarboxylase-like protein